MPLAPCTVALQPLPAFLTKCQQLYEMILVRHGLMLVGAPYSMKSSALKTLAGALADMQASGVRGGGGHAPTYCNVQAPSPRVQRLLPPVE